MSQDGEHRAEEKRANRELFANTDDDSHADQSAPHALEQCKTTTTHEHESRVEAGWPTRS